MRSWLALVLLIPVASAAPLPLPCEGSACVLLQGEDCADGGHSYLVVSAAGAASVRLVEDCSQGDATRIASASTPVASASWYDGDGSNSISAGLVLGSVRWSDGATCTIQAPLVPVPCPTPPPHQPSLPWALLP